MRIEDIIFETTCTGSVATINGGFTDDQSASIYPPTKNAKLKKKKESLMVRRRPKG